MARKPAWIIAKERAARQGGAPVWLFGLHAVRDALANPRRRCLTLVMTPNARERLGPVADRPGLAVRTADPRRFDAPLDPGSVHQGAALEVLPLDWGPLAEVCAPEVCAPEVCAPEVCAHGGDPLVLLLDRVTDPHNVGAVLRSAEVFGARAVIAPHRHAAPETGALAKAASGALERMPYLRVPNLAEAMAELRTLGYRLIGLDGTAEKPIESALAGTRGPVGLVLGAEGPGLRQRTRESCDLLARIEAAGGFGSLNVSNAAAVALYAARRREFGARG